VNTQDRACGSTLPVSAGELTRTAAVLAKLTPFFEKLP